MRRLTTLATLLFVAACGSDDPAGTNVSALVGTYDCTHVNGIALPVAFGDVVLTAGTMTIAAEGSYTMSETICEGGSCRNEGSSGTWTETAAGFSFYSTTYQYSGTATVSGQTLMVHAGGLIYQFQRR